MTIHDGVAYHTALAADWDRRYARGGFRRRARFFRAMVLPRLALEGDWMDLGCGSGYFARMLCEADARVSGVDGSPEMIRAARSLSAADPRTRGISFATMEFDGRLQFADASLDGILCLSVLEYLDRPEASLAEIVRVVRPGGQIVVSVPNRNSAVRGLQQAKRALSTRRKGGEAYLSFSRWSTSAAELRTLMIGQGLSDIEILPFDPAIPRMMLAVVPASLLYAVARKPGQGAEPRSGAPAKVSAAV